MEEIIEKVCKHLPKDKVIILTLEHGSASISLWEGTKRKQLPDSTDKTIVEQLNEALCVANGFK